MPSASARNTIATPCKPTNLLVMIWQTAHHSFDLSAHGIIMGILNVTPDSFSDGGQYLDSARAVAHGLDMIAQGATIIDVGGESTRPGAETISIAEELRRVLPVVEGLLAAAPECMVSVDTSKAEVADAALARGAAIINDVTALRGDTAMADVIARAGAGVILMHMQGTPQTMQHHPFYRDVTAEVRVFFEQCLATARASGIAANRIAFDPGIGFGKTVDHNLTLLRELEALRVGDRPLVLGVSRKAFLGKVTDAQSPSDRLWPTVAMTALLRERGARVLRVHDVRPNMAALRIAEALLAAA